MKTYFFIILIILCTACEKEIDMDIDSKPAKLVINCWLQPDSFIKLHLSKSLHILGNDAENISTASISVFEDGKKIDSLSYSGNGFYKSKNFKPSIGKLYRIEASAPGYPTAIAETRIPDTVAISKINIDQKIIEYTNDTFKYVFYENTINIEFTDPQQEENYYLIYIEEFIDNTTRLTGYNTSSPLIELVGNYSFLDEFFIVEDDMGINTENRNFYAGIMAFSDTKFNGKKNDLRLHLSPVINAETKHFKFNLTSISKDYYEYIKAIVYVNNDNPFAEKVQAYTNIKNGLGVILSSNANKRSFEIQKNKKKII